MFHIHLPSSLFLEQIKMGHRTKNFIYIYDLTASKISTYTLWAGETAQWVRHLWPKLDKISLIPRPTWYKERTTPLRSIHELRHIRANVCTHTQYRNT